MSDAQSVFAFVLYGQTSNLDDKKRSRPPKSAPPSEPRSVPPRASPAAPPSSGLGPPAGLSSCSSPGAPRWQPVSLCTRVPVSDSHFQAIASLSDRGLSDAVARRTSEDSREIARRGFSLRGRDDAGPALSGAAHPDEQFHPAMPISHRATAAASRAPSATSRSPAPRARSGTRLPRPIGDTVPLSAVGPSAGLLAWRDRRSSE